MSANPTPRPEPFPITRADEINSAEGPNDFVEDLLTDAGASVVYGPSNCGKSFWVLDLASHVAMGKAWRFGEKSVEQGAVIYVALEGSHGIKNRVAALRQSQALPQGCPFYLCFHSVSLLEAGDALRMAETVAKAADDAVLPVRLVILDTLARAMAGGDENSAGAMTFAVSSIDAIRQSTGAHVMVIHHCGKDEAKGARGHSSLRAAVDTEIEVSKPEGESISTVRVTKQRDLERCEPMPFSLEVVELGTNRRGKPITSCIVKHLDEVMAATPKKSGRPPKCHDEDVLALLPQESTSAWETLAKAELGVARATFFEVKKRLNEGKRIFQTSTKGWSKVV